MNGEERGRAALNWSAANAQHCCLPCLHSNPSLFNAQPCIPCTDGGSLTRRRSQVERLLAAGQQQAAQRAPVAVPAQGEGMDMLLQT